MIQKFKIKYQKHFLLSSCVVEKGWYELWNKIMFRIVIKLKVVGAERPLKAVSLIISVRETRISKPPAEQEPSGHQDKERMPAAPLRTEDQESFTQSSPISPL